MWWRPQFSYLHILWEFNFIFPRSGVNSSWICFLYYQKCKSYGAMNSGLWKPDLVALYADSKVAFQFLNPKSKEQWMCAVQIIIQHGILPWDPFTLIAYPFWCKECVKYSVLAHLLIIVPCKETKLTCYCLLESIAKEETSKVTPTYPQQPQTLAGSWR